MSRTANLLIKGPTGGGYQASCAINCRGVASITLPQSWGKSCLCSRASCAILVRIPQVPVPACRFKSGALGLKRSSRNRVHSTD